jgi:hypothetical protein
MSVSRIPGLLFLLLAMLLPFSPAWAQRGKAPADGKPGWVDSAKLPPGKYTGWLKTTPGADGFFEMEMEIGTGGNKSKITAEFQLHEKAKVRTVVLPEAFDSKGNIKKYDAKMLSELKGVGEERKLPGYATDIEELRTGQKVVLNLVSVPRPAPAKGSKPKSQTEPDEEDGPKPPKPRRVSYLVITESSDAPAVRGKK